MSRAAALAVLLATTALGGCAGLMMGSNDYACRGVPDGVSCQSVKALYAATEQTDQVAGGRPALEAVAPVASSVEVIPAVARPVGSLPLRSPAEVMRIWVAPWEDEAGDLHMPGYVYTEIEPRRWRLGERPSVPEVAITPLQVPRREAGERPRVAEAELDAKPDS